METIEQIISRVLKEKNISQNRLGELMDMSGAQVSDVYSGNAKPGLKFCKGLAKVAGLSEEYVVKAAGLLPQTSPLDERRARIYHKATLLSDEKLDEYERWLDFQLQEQEREEAQRSPARKVAHGKA